MKFSKRCLLPVLALILSGCAGYRVGSSLPESIQSVSIAVENKTDEPSVEVQVMKSLRAELQMDGRLDVRPQSDADAILTVTLNRYQLTPVAFDHKQGSLAREYRVTLSARAVLSDAATGEVILETPMVLGEEDFDYAGDLTSAKMRALPAAADDMARKVISTVVTAW
jgi:hypothetical protein